MSESSVMWLRPAADHAVAGARCIQLRAHKDEFPCLPVHGGDREIERPAPRLAQHRHVCGVWSPIDVKSGVDESTGQAASQLQHRLRRHAGPDPGYPIVIPASRRIQSERKRLERRACCRRLHVAHLLQRNIAQECERKMNRLPTRRLATQPSLQVSSDVRERGLYCRFWPQSKEEPGLHGTHCAIGDAEATSINATACAAIPSPRPVKPSRSLVLA